MNVKSKASLVLIEKLIVVVVFAICAAACAGIFVESYLMANSARDLSYALAAAKNGAERLKAYGNLSDTAESLGGRVYVDEAISAVVYYDSDWVVSEPDLAAYVMRIQSAGGSVSELFLSELSVEKLSGENILSFMVAFRSRF